MELTIFPSGTVCPNPSHQLHLTVIVCVCVSPRINSNKSSSSSSLFRDIHLSSLIFAFLTAFGLFLSHSGGLFRICWRIYYCCDVFPDLSTCPPTHFIFCSLCAVFVRQRGCNSLEHVEHTHTHVCIISNNYHHHCGVGARTRC